MTHTQKLASVLALVLMTCAPACKKEEPVNTQPQPTPAAAAPAAPEATPEAAPEAPAVDETLSQLSRDDFNHAAQRLNLPIFWTYEDTPSKTVRPEVLRTLNFYPTSASFVWKDADGNFTKAFRDAYALMVDVMKDPTLGTPIEDPAERTRREKVAQELDQAAITLVASDFSDENERDFVRAMLQVGEAIDTLYARQVGLDKIMARIPADDIISQSMARRNWGVMPQSPKMKNDPECRTRRRCLHPGRHLPRFTPALQRFLRQDQCTPRRRNAPHPIHRRRRGRRRPQGRALQPRLRR